MDKLKKGYILALSILKTEIEELKVKNETIKRERDVTRNLIEPLRAQRTIIQNQCNALKQSNKIKLRNVEDEVARLKQSLAESENKSLNVRVELLSQLSLCHQTIIASKDHHLELVCKLSERGEELDRRGAEFARREVEFARREVELVVELARKETELVKKEVQLEKLIKTHQMQMLRSALTTFERGENWMEFFKNSKAEKALQEVCFQGNIQRTVISHFSKMNAKVHDTYYPLTNEMVITEDAIAPDEQKLILALWKLSPLKKGTIKIKSSRDE